MRQITFLDNLVGNLDKCIRTIGKVQVQGSRPNPSVPVINKSLSTREIKKSANLMRINHTGEVCAQALYLGQALVSHNPKVKKQLLDAAQEEQDHLTWCDQRLQELNSHSSYLNPLWWAGSFTLGILAGIAGDKWGLGFVMETENQVSNHLNDHLDKLPAGDHKSRAIIAQMEWEERQHASLAQAHGAAPLPAPIPFIMHCASKVMTTTVYFV